MNTLIVLEEKEDVRVNLLHEAQSAYIWGAALSRRHAVCISPPWTAMHCNLQNKCMRCGPGLSMAPAARMEFCEDHLLAQCQEHLRVWR